MAKRKAQKQPKDDKERRADFIPGRLAVLFRIDKIQDDAIEAEAIRRQKERKALRADKSEVVREALDRFFHLKGKK